MVPTFEQLLEKVRDWPEHYHAYGNYLDFECEVLNDGRGSYDCTYYGWTGWSDVDDGWCTMSLNAKANFPEEGWSEIEVPEIYQGPIADSMAAFILKVRRLFKENDWEILPADIETNIYVDNQAIVAAIESEV